MKVLGLMLLMFLAAGAVTPQNPSPVSDQGDVVVLQSSWRKEFRNPALDADPMSANTEQRERARAEKQNIRENAIRIREGRSPEPTPQRIKPLETGADAPYAVYVYKAKIRNDGAKAIREILWEYVFVDPDTEKEIARHRHTSKVKLAPGKSGNLVERSASYPVSVVSASRAGREPGEQFTERVVIHRVVYADGSVWISPAK